MVVEDDGHRTNADTFKHPLDGVDPKDYKPEVTEGPKDDDDEDRMDEPIIDQEIAKLQIKDGRVMLFIREVIEYQPIGEEKPRKVVNEYPIKSGFLPHQELTDAFTSMRKPILDVIEPKMTTVEKNKWDVQQIVMKGHLEDKTLKLSAILFKEVPGTDKPVDMKVKDMQVFLLPEKEREAMVKALQHMKDEGWDYVDGKHRHGIQLGFGPVQNSLKKS